MVNKLILTTFIYLMSIQLYAQSNSTFYYYVNNEKQNLEVLPNYYLLQFDEKNRKKKNIQIDGIEEIQEINIDGETYYYVKTEYNINTKNKLQEVFENLGLSLNFIHECFGDENGKITSTYLNKVFLQPTSNIQDIIKTNSSTFSSIDEVFDYDVPAYVLNLADNFEGDVFALANSLYESDIVYCAEPKFIFFNTLQCNGGNINDSKFPDQWYLNNTSQQGVTGIVDGIDINICLAWDYSMGSSDVTVAVLDGGIQLDHPDLVPNIVGGYDAITDTDSDDDPDAGQEPGGGQGHGTKCAGIIAAQHNNDGIAGIVPNVNIMPIRVIDGNLFGITVEEVQQNVGRGINKAIDKGADILSMSFNIAQTTNDVSLAIKNAIDNGRDGKGAILVVSSGNEENSSQVNTSLGYPARDGRTIAVGALKPNGYRVNGTYTLANPNTRSNLAWDSKHCKTYDLNNPTHPNYINCNLTVSAPGVYMATTNKNSGYTNFFWGTSSAAPQVAGVAALLISESPCLKYDEVKEAIARSANKDVGNFSDWSAVGSTTWEPEGNYPYGDFNHEIGYGRLNAYAALQIITNLYVQNLQETTAKIYQSAGKIEAGRSVTGPTPPVGDYQLENGANIEFRVGQRAILKPGFKAKAGSSFKAFVIDLDDCSNWDDDGIIFNSPKPIKSNLIEGEIEELENSYPKLQIFPNPANSQLNIRTSENIQTGQIFLLNAIGQVIRNERYNNSKHQFEVQDLPVGMYYISILSNGERYTEKVIVSH